MKKIGLLGGTFDPIHNGHIAMAKAAYEKAGLDKVILVPGGNPPHKDAVTADKYDRLAMARIAAEGFGWITVSDYEVLKESYCYSVETLKHFKEELKDADLFFILGADSYKALPTWYKYEELCTLCRFLVCEREGTLLGPDAKCVGMVPVPVSSTELRQKQKNGESIEGYVPRGVYEYIQKNRLYKG